MSVFSSCGIPGEQGSIPLYHDDQFFSVRSRVSGECALESRSEGFAIPLLPLFRILAYLKLEAAVQLGRLNKEFYFIISQLWCPETLELTYDLRQKLRRQIFLNKHDISLPSHFTHLFSLNPRHDILRQILFKRRRRTDGELQLTSDKPHRLLSLIHHRSSKTLKLHHPYFYRQLPLAITPDAKLSDPVLNPEDIPLPHDLSLLDIFQLLIQNHKSLKRVIIDTFDTSPLPWNSTPSRVCPRDILTKCCYQTLGLNEQEPVSPGSVCVWCPDCKPAQHEHSLCWRAAGAYVINTFLKPNGESPDPTVNDTALALERGLSGGIGPVFSELETLRFCGWGVTNFMAIMRIFGISFFPKLETLELSGTVIMAPALTDTKDAEPRPSMHLESLPIGLCPLEREELEERLMQIMSFHISPFARYANLIPPRANAFGVKHYLPHVPEMPRSPAVAFPRLFENDDLALGTPATNRSQLPIRTSPLAHSGAAQIYTYDCRRYKEQAVKEYWMGNFNGHLWRPEGFPKLRRLTLKVGNFDDACRWITPMMANCFARCTELRELELDHTVLYPLRQDNPIIKLFTLCASQWEQSASTYFPNLRFLMLRSVESPFQLAELQRQVSIVVKRPIVVKTRKLFIRVASERAAEEAALIRHWPHLQRARLNAWLGKNEASLTPAVVQEMKSFSDAQLSMFNSVEEGSAMLMLNFDSHDVMRNVRAVAAGELGQEVADAQSLVPPLPGDMLCYGSHVAKVQLKQFTPTNVIHRDILNKIRFCDTTGEQIEDMKTLFEFCAPELTSNMAYPIDPSRLETVASGADYCDASCASSQTINLIPRSKPIRRVTIQFDLPQIWQHTPEQAKVAVTQEVSMLRQLLQSHPDLKDVSEARVMSCTRLTYGGSNWPWWEELICGRVRKRVRQVGSGSWVRESREILNEDELRVFKCSHVITRNCDVQSPQRDVSNTGS
eukprot:Blabericola_migrator_1__8503@NODE_443_length_8422_cov_363_622023_g348_i0_p1_GENE_NODE_443_length_8422_cov_363_622023_g348_i0NODE_443_length_8422_cov_363_622023_g348_i0_p1_ORF_typecomplete_len954_score113_64_NODE_443_length_8422_cov_363_622023_g348_i029545815